MNKKTKRGGEAKSMNNLDNVKANKFSPKEKAKIRKMKWKDLVDTYVGQAVMYDVLSGSDTVATRRGQKTLDALREVLGAAAWKKVRHAPQVLAMVVTSPKKRAARG